MGLVNKYLKALWSILVMEANAKEITAPTTEREKSTLLTH